MEDGHTAIADVDGEKRPPPPAPRPSADTQVKPDQVDYTARSDTPLRLTSEQWDICSLSATSAMRMLQEALDALSEATGDVPPTPPISRPVTPTRDSAAAWRKHSDTGIPDFEIGSPVAHPHEPIHNIDAGTDSQIVQHAAIARRFFSKVAPSFSLADYLNRIHQWCPHSPGVYLAAAAYCYRLSVAEYMVPATKRTIHRLALASIRVAAKALEDNKWTQDRVAKVGGVGLTQLMNLEVSLCFLLDFDLWMDDKKLAKSMFLLQEACRQGSGSRGRLSEFKLRLPLRKRRILEEVPAV